MHRHLLSRQVALVIAVAKQPSVGWHRHSEAGRL